MTIARLEALQRDYVRHCIERDRLSRRLEAAGMPGLRTSPADAAVWRAIHAAIDQLEAAANAGQATA